MSGPSDAEREPLASLAARAARSNLMMTPAIALLALAASVVVVRLLAPDQFALYAVALAIRGTAQFLADLGTGAASTRVFAELHARGSGATARRAYRQLAAVRIGVVIALGICVLAFPDVLKSVLNLRDDEDYFLVFALLIGTAEIAAGLGFYALTGLFGHVVLNRIVLAQNLLQPTLVIVAAAAGSGLPGILGGVLAGSALKALLFNLAAMRALRRIPDGSPGDLDARSYARVAASSGSGKLASWVHSRQAVSVIAIGTLPRVEVARFALAYDFVHQVLIAASSPFYSLMLPAFSSAGESRQRELFAALVRILALTVFPVAAALLAVFSPLAMVLFGPPYADTTQYAAIFVPLLAIELATLGPATGFMLARDDLVNVFARIRVLTAAGGLAYLFVGSFGLLVASGLMMGFRVLSALTLHAVVKQRTGAQVSFAWWSRILLAACISGGLGALTAQVGVAPGIQIIAGGVVALTAFSALVRPLRLLTSQDASILTQAVPRAGTITRWFTGGTVTPTTAP